MAVRINTIQGLLTRPHGNWIHLLLGKDAWRLTTSGIARARRQSLRGHRAFPKDHPQELH